MCPSNRLICLLFNYLLLRVCYRGMLTGKYKRGVRPNPKEGRIGVVAQDESKAMQIAPAWSQYDQNDEYWKLVEGMEKIAKDTGLRYSFVVKVED